MAVIPTRYEPARIAALARLISPDVDRVLLFDNGHAPPLKSHGKVEVIDCRGEGIYRAWNRGWQMALDANPVNVAVLNDDIHVLPRTLRMLAKALRADDRLGCVYPDQWKPLSAGLPSEIRVEALYDPISSREMTGFCFMFKGELPLPAFDEAYQWWYADTVFDEAVKLAGYGVGRVVGLPIAHVSDAETNDWARRPELKHAVEQDGVRWAALHDRIEDGRWVPK